ncbi:OmpH family outer membrane protein [Sphingomonas morindae]|uniref:OmpH family outer membrane protein n=1 Tax=Sphingomonas morindae TaxID=1541170 RepID=A0ABY4X6J8_9SPHN|nr:OmpH family outer membrane protein [Sphingomonas morindae]USI72504.1 OmpH family outer membrane protein [Sphingomonas morindae]
MTKSFKSALFIAAAVVAAGPAFAQVLVVDFNRVFQESAAAKSGTQQLQTKFNTQLTQRRTSFQSAAQAYNSQLESARKAAKPNTPLPAATQTALQQAGEAAQKAQQELQETQEDVNEAAGYVRQQIIERATPLAEQIRAERKAQVVVAKEQVLAADPSIDVTSVLIQRLDASFPTPSVTPPQQGAAPAATGNRAAPTGR